MTSFILVQLKYAYAPYYSTNLALGTPNQPARVALDLSFNSLFVQSSECHSLECENYGRARFSYNGSQSETHESNGTQFSFVAAGTSVRGNITEDIMHLVNLGVDDMLFGEYTDIASENFQIIAMQASVDG